MNNKNTGNPPIYTLNIKGKLMELDSPKVMGILNANDDSFFAGSRVGSRVGSGMGSRVGAEAAVARAGEMIAAGASFLDIGGQSTRPGSLPISAAEETDRVCPLIEAISGAFPDIPISVDTYHSSVAASAIASGAGLVNDISSGSMDADMIPTVASLRVPYIAMHMQGTPLTMQQHPDYEDVTREIIQYLAQVTYTAKKAGIHDVVVDPGFGFGKDIAHNYQLLDQLELLSILDQPILVGLSRKSMIYKPLGLSPEQALNGTIALNTLALYKGAHILRVHDVGAAVETVRLVSLLSGQALRRIDRGRPDSLEANR
jgi:dihydropteroate synthase